jgi:hypothetical protein
VRLLVARLGDQLDCTGAKVHNDSGPALHAAYLQVDQNAFLSRGFTEVGARSAVAVDLPGVRVGGVLVF